MALTPKEIQDTIDEYNLMMAYSIDFSEVEGALRPTERACQYFLSGLAPWCVYWNSEDHKCIFEENDASGDIIIPSMYNDGNCDFLGRASKCSQYKATEETDEGYFCVAPNMYLCGLGTKDDDGFLHPIPRDEIKGYNEVEGIGKCDGEGKGTGVCGYEGDPDKCPVICNYYRPWRMSFGSLEPQSFESVLKGEPAPKVLGRRLPFTFSIYNLRARLQKCAYWDGSAGKFQIDDNGRVTIDVTPFDVCTCGELEAWDYLEMDGNSPEWVLDGVWANGASCIVCNGAKPECPYYTGKWLYVADEKMQDGSKISAQQILELRYWLKFWKDQDEYEAYFSGIRPNRSDPTTSSIFTFLKWERLGQTSSDALGVGAEVKLLLDFPTLDISIKKSESINGDNVVFIGSTVKDAKVYLVNTTIVGYHISQFDDETIKNMLTTELDIVYPKNVMSETKEFTDDNLDIKTVKYSKIGQEIGIKTTDNINDKQKQVSFPSLVRDINEIYNIDQDKLDVFYKAIAEYIREVTKSSFENIANGVAGEDGFFTVGPISLKYQTNNRLVLIIEVGDGAWTFQRVDIWSQWYGGLVIQDKFENKFGKDDSGYEDRLPERFSGETVVEGELKAITGMNSHSLYTKVGNTIPTSSTYTETIFGPRQYYSYFIKSTICKDITVSEWARVGFSMHVAAKIDDIKLNYLYSWEVISATMVEIADVPIKRRIEMKVVYPSTYSSSGNSAIRPNDDQRYIDPTMFIIKPKDDSIKIGFRNSEWELEVTYKYTELVNENPADVINNHEDDTEEVIWPTFPVDGDGNLDPTESPGYIPVDFNIEQDGNKITVSDINAKTVGVLASFTDEEGRLMSTVATKFCTMVTRVFCRNVDIKYGYGSPAVGYKLIPESGLATYIGGDQIIADFNPIHGFYPPCKDHEYSGDCGFMWYPFQACNDTVVFYTVFANAAFCTAPYGEIWGEEMYRDDYRFCGPEKYKAFVGGGGGMADCQVRWAYRYSKAQEFPGGSYFSGRANIKGIVNLLIYKFEGWVLPPFGNKGREMITRFMSQEHHGHLSYINPAKPSVKYEWMPMVMDNEMFFTGFNAFDETSYIDCFSSYNQLNFYLSDQIEEEYDMEKDKITKKRFKFDELFNVRTFIFCSYPHPLNVDGKAVFYQFKNEEYAWAWREIWKDLERGFELLSFILLDQPPYRLCRDKIYHQYVCGEGKNIIKYNAPKMEDGVMIVYPSIALGNGPKRYFNPLYGEDGYDLQRVEWKDIDGGEVGGEANDNIYHKTTVSGNWNHNENLIFDSEAVDNEEAARKAGREFKDPTDEAVVYAYNRGLISNLYRNRLQYMPFSEEIFKGESWLSYSITPMEYEHIPSSVWSRNVIITCDITKVKEEGACISKVKIKGNWGKFVDGKLFCMLGVLVRSGDDISSATIISQPEWKFVKIASDSSDWDQYELELELNMTPFRMLDVGAKKRKLFIDLYTRDDQSINVSEIIFYEAEYENSIEEITVWEQKYVVSKGDNFGDYNLNGPNSTLSFERNMDNSGQYFPAGPNCAYKEKTETLNKMRSVYAGIETAEDTSLSVTLDNLLEVEQEEQMKLYKEAYNLDKFGDNFVYAITMPKYLSDFFENNNINYNVAGIAKFIGERLEWGKHALYKAYKSGEFWQPEGHKFEWSKNVWTQKCRIGQYGSYIGGVGPVETIHDADFIHMDTQTAVETMSTAESLRWGRMEYQWQVFLISNKGEPLDAAASPLGIAGSFVDTR